MSPFFMAYFFKLGLQNNGNCKKNTKSVKKPSVITKLATHKQNAEIKKKVKKLNTELRNVDNYDGTGIGQEVIK